MHYLQPIIGSTLSATASIPSALLPEVRHLDIPWKEFYCRTITKTTCTGTSLGLDISNTLSSRDQYILSLHAKTRNTITPRCTNRRPTRSLSLPLSISTRSPSIPPLQQQQQQKKHLTTVGTRTIAKRFRREGSHLLRLQKAVLMKNSFEAAARDFDARGNGFAAEKQRKRAKLPQRYIDKIAEQDDPSSWTFPPNRMNASRGGWMPIQKSTLASVSFR